MVSLRPAMVGLVLLSCLAAATAAASTFSFGAVTWRSDLSLSSSIGSGSNQNSSQFALSTATNVNFRAQASADTVFEDAIADWQYVWDVPYTITRNVSVSACCPGVADATFPIQGVFLGITFSGAVGVDEFGGDEAAEIFNGISVVSLGGRIPGVSLNGGSRSNSDGSNPITGGTTTGYLTSVNFADGSSAGEIGFLAPTDYRAWQDLVPVQALDYTLPHTIVQSLTDTLRVSFRVRAVSRPSGSISTTAGEAIACAGLQSGLGGFSLVPNCGSGLSISGAVGEFGSETQTVAVPEPGTLLLTGTTLVGLALWARRRIVGLEPGTTGRGRAR